MIVSLQKINKNYFNFEKDKLWMCTIAIHIDRYFGFEQLGNADELGPCGWVWRLASFMNFDGMQ